MATSPQELVGVNRSRTICCIVVAELGHYGIDSDV